MQNKERYFFYILLIAIALLCGAIFLPFVSVLIVGAALAVVFHPLYLWIKAHIALNKSWLASLLVLLFCIVVLAVPLFFIGVQVFEESENLYTLIASGNVPDFQIGSLDLRQSWGDIAAFFAGNVKNIFTSTVHGVFSAFLVFLSLFYFLKDSASWKKNIMHVSPLSDDRDEYIITQLERAVNGVMKGYIMIALVQGILLGIGLALFGVPNAALWGLLAGIASLVPSIGTALVSIPAIIYLWSMGHDGAAIGLGVWAAVLVGMIDNVLSPIIVGRSIELPPLVMLFAVLGGITLFGAPGVIVGPLAVSLLTVLIPLSKEKGV